MTGWLYIINDGAVGLFGALLSAAFCGISWTRQNRLRLGAVITGLGILQALLFAIFGADALRLWYPLITHLPLAIALGLLGKNWLWGAVSVLTAYLCCQLRRWTALLVVAVFNGGEALQAAVELAVTLPLLLLLLRFAAPAVRSMSRQPRSTQLQFSLLPAIGYIFDYLTRIYTDWLIQGIPAAVEFMPFVCSAAYLVFALHSVEALRRHSELQQVQAVLDLQLRQSSQQIANMKQYQAQAAAHRHDLRHHLQYLSACIDSGALDQARNYIRSLDAEITQQALTQYCENTAANLILSSYAARAAEMGVSMAAQVSLGEKLPISDNDLCVLLSNALENALHACAAMSTQSKAQVEVTAFEEGEQVLLEVRNSCALPPSFANGIPTTEKPGHGLGVRSICAIVEKYDGVYIFKYESGRLILRISL